MPSPKRVFCSHCQCDHAQVQAFAEKLVARGIDVWCREWEFHPGDDLSARVRDGLDECDAGLFFFSKGPSHSECLDARLLELMRSRSQRLIPVALEPDAPLPPQLSGAFARCAEDVEGIVQAIRAGG